MTLAVSNRAGSLFSSALSELDVDDIKAFCKLGIAENVSVDYKKEMPSNENFKVAKTVSSMANTDGGIVIFGVEEKQGSDGRGVPDKLKGVPKTERLASRVKKICFNAINPPVIVDVETYEVDADNEFVLVRIPESEEAPHRAIDNKVARVYVRAFDNSEPLNFDQEATPEQIEWLLNRRRRPEELREALIVRAKSRCPRRDVTNFVDRPLVAIAVLPTYPRRLILPRHDLLKSMLVNVRMAQTERDYRNANESVYRRKMPNTGNESERWYGLEYTEANRYGLVFHAHDARSDPAGSFGQYTPSVDVIKLLTALIQLLDVASRFYSGVEFFGLCTVEISVANVRNFRVLIRDGEETSLLTSECIDEDFSIRKNLGALELTDETLLCELYQEFLASMGVEQSYKDSVFSSHLATATNNLSKKSFPYLVSFRLPDVLGVWHALDYSAK